MEKTTYIDHRGHEAIPYRATCVRPALERGFESADGIHPLVVESHIHESKYAAGKRVSNEEAIDRPAKQ